VGEGVLPVKQSGGEFFCAAGKVLRCSRKVFAGCRDDFSTGIKKAAANAAAKVRRWIKELQINVSEHRGDKPKSSIYLKSVSNGLSCSKGQCFVLHGVFP
jgi:hypothetical protein